MTVVWSPNRRGTYHAHSRRTESARSLCGRSTLNSRRGLYAGHELTPAQLDRRCRTCLQILGEEREGVS